MSFPLSSSTPERDEISSVDFTRVQSFDFTFASGSALDGFNVCEISSSGEVKYTFQGHDPTTGMHAWQESTFTLDSKTLADLRSILNDVSILGLARRYIAKVNDGSQIAIRVKAGTLEKKILCANHFPEEIRQVADFVQEKILDRNLGHLKQASSSAEPSTDWIWH